MSARRVALALAAASLVGSGLLLVGGCGGGGGDGDGDAAGGEDVEFAIPGDAAKGKTVYEKQGCGRCHTFAAAGSTATTGPNLDEAVKKYNDADFIRESIIAPRAYVEMGSGGSIGGNKEYPDVMPSYGPRAESDKIISEQDVNNLTVFLMEEAED